MSTTSSGERREPGFVLARVRGVPLVVNASWLLIAVLLSFVYGPLIADAVPDMSDTAAYAAGVGFAVLFALCVLAHELAHTLASVRLGYSVRRIVLFALGGVSEVDGEPERARDELLIAGAGPLASLVIGALAWGGYVLAPAATLLAALLGLLAWSNLVLAAFNLLPGLPLDGGRMLRAAVWGCGGAPLTGTRVACWSGRLVAVAVAASGLIADRSSLGIAAGAFSIGLAAYLWFGATASLRVAELNSRLPGIKVRELLRPGLFVPSDLSVGEALRRAWESKARGLVLLDTAEKPSAIVDEAQISAVAPDQRPWTPVSAVARPLEPGLVLTDDVDAEGLLRHMQDTPAHEYLVLHEDGSAAGIIATRDFARLLRGAT